MVKWISKYVWAQTHRFISADVQAYIKEQLLVTIPLHQIRKNLKEKLRMSYKKGNPRPVTLDVAKLRLTKQLFWIRLAQKLPEIKLLVNIDESSFSNSTKKNYSWLEKVKSCALNNIVFQNSINVISCITSNGLSINLFKYISSTAKFLFLFSNIYLSI